MYTEIRVNVLVAQKIFIMKQAVELYTLKCCNQMKIHHDEASIEL
jgi:hypothetical protein